MYQFTLALPGARVEKPPRWLPPNVADAKQLLEEGEKELKNAQNKIRIAKKRLSELGSKGNESPKRKRRLELAAKKRAAAKMIEVQRKAEAKRAAEAAKAERRRIADEQKVAAKRSAAVRAWVADPANYEEECRLRDEAANLHTHPID